jgi:CRP-like cAMP-binding protein
MTTPLANDDANRLLAGMPREPYFAFRALLKPVSLRRNEILTTGNRPIQAAYFLDSGLASVAWSGSGDRLIDVSVLGCDGMVGSPLVLGLRSTPFRITMLTKGTALCIGAEKLISAMAADPRLRDYLLRAPARQLMHVAQTAACNGIHQIHHRLPRWLLMCQDQLQSEPIPLSHETLSDMLGVRRAGIGDAIAVLERKGIIRSSRSAITVLDRARLEAEACSCYRALQKQGEKLDAAGTEPLTGR